MYEYDPKLQREYAAKQLGIKKPAGNVGSFEEPTLTENRGGVDLYSYKPKEQENLLSYAAKKYKSAVGALEEDVAKPIGEALKATAAAGSPLQEQPQYLPPETTQAVEKFAKSVEKDLTEHGQEWKASDKSASVADFEKENPIAAPIASVVSSTPATVARMAPYFTELGIPLIAGKAIKEGAEVEGDVYDKAKAIAGNVAKEAATVATLGSTGKMAGFTKRALANTGTMALRSQVDRVQAGGKADMETLAEDFAYSMPAGMIFAAPRIKTDRAVKKLNQELDIQAAKMKAGQDANTSQAIDAMSSGVKKLAEDVAYGRMEKPESISLTPEFKEQFGLGNKKVSEPPKKSVGAAGQDLTTSAIPLTELPKEPITVKTEAGVKTTITPKQGEEFTVTPYKTSDGKVKFELHDGESYTVTKNTATELVNKFGLVERDFSIPKELEVVKKGGIQKPTDANIKWEQTIPGEWRAQVGNRKFGMNQEAGGIYVYEDGGVMGQVVNNFADAKEKVINALSVPPKTQYTQYQLAKGQGAKNYREVLLKAPTKEPADFPNKAVFKSSHWDEPNVIAHTRLAEHTPKSGGQTTLMEELQSDWAREGRDKGFNTEPPRGMEAWEQDGKWFVGSKDTGAALREGIANTREEAIAKTYATGMYQNAGVPHHPALKNWTEHGLKHAIKEAVDAGSDTLSWVTGKQTADRYDLSKQVDEIAYDKNADGSYRIQAFKNNPDLPVIEKDVAEKDLASVVGKDVAQKIISGDGKQDGDLKVLSGKDLMVSAGWTTNLYDRQIPNLLKDLTKGYGTQFKDITLENGETVHSMTLTPRLKAAFQKDQGTVGAMSKGGKADSDLLEEARKYKTAEEFANSVVTPYPQKGWERLNLPKGIKSDELVFEGNPYKTEKQNEIWREQQIKQKLTSIWNEANKKSVGARGKDIPSDSVPIELPPKVEINTLEGKKTITPKAGEPFTVDAIQEANGVTEDISPKEATRLVDKFGTRKPSNIALPEVIKHGAKVDPEIIKKEGFTFGLHSRFGRAGYFNDKAVPEEYAFNENWIISIDPSSLRWLPVETLEKEQQLIEQTKTKDIADATRALGYDGFIIPNEDPAVGTTYGIVNKTKLDDLIQQKPTIATGPQGGPPVSNIKADGKEVPRPSFRVDKINAPQDVIDLMKDVAVKSGEFREQRPTGSLEELQRLAKESKLSVDDLLDVAPRSIMSSPDLIRATEIRNTLAKDLSDFTKTIDTATATPEQLAEFKKKFLRLQGVMKTLAGVRTEASNIFRSLQAVNSLGDSAALQSLLGDIKRIDVNAAGDLGKFTRQTKDLVEATLGDKLWHLWYASILSGPATHIKNILGNISQMNLELARIAATDPAAFPSAITGLIKSLGPAVKEAGGIFKHGAPSKFEARGIKPIVFKGIFRPLNIADYVGRTLEGVDTFFKGATGGMELRQLAYAKAKSEGLKGKQLKEAIYNYIENPTPEMQEAVQEYRKYMTYQQKPEGLLGAIAEGIGKAAGGYARLRLIVPFTNVVSNVVNNAIDWTPWGLTRVARDYYKSKTGKESHSTRRRQQDLGRAVVGTLLFAGAAALAANDRITGRGPSNLKKKQQLMASGWKPNSIVFTDKDGNKTYIPYTHYAGPAALTMGMAANYMDAVKYGDLTEKDALERASLAVLGTANLVLEMSFLQGVSDLLTAVNNSDMFGASYIRRTLAQQASSPYPNLIKQIDRFFDPTVYESDSVKESILSSMRITDGLRPKVDVFGDPVIGDRLTQLTPSKQKKDDIKTFLANKQLWLSVPPKNTKILDRETFQPREMTPKEYYDFIKISGQKIKSQLGDLKDVIADSDPEIQQNLVEKIVDQQREAVKKMLEAGIEIPQ